MHISAASPAILPPQKPPSGRPANGADLHAPADSSKKEGTNSQELNEKQRAQVASLKSRDREVRAHEAAHLAAAGGLARGGASFSYTVGPDNHRYAVGGEVSIDTSPGNTPQETLARAQTILAAALAPAKPSGQDRAVAASASQMAAQARSDIATEKAAESTGQDQETRQASRERAVENYTQAAMADSANDNRIDLVV